MSKYQALIDALNAGPTDGPWEFGSYAGGQIRIGPNGESKHCHFLIMTGSASVPWDDTEESKEAFNNAAYIAAANPATIRSLLADLERAEKALRFYADPCRYHGPNQRLNKTDEFSPDDAVYLVDVTRDCGAIATAALSQLKGVQGGGD